MSKTPDNDHCATAGDIRPACRIAYMLNNSQPVRCTIIGDEPLFYMDYTGHFDDGDSELGLTGFDSDFDEIDRGIAALKDKIDMLDRMAGDSLAHASELPEKLVGLFIDDVARATVPVCGERTDPDIAALEAVLRKSRMIASFLDFAAQAGATMSWSRQIDGAFYDRNANVVFIHPDLDPADRILAAARELRRLWQHRNGALIHPLTFAPEQAILVGRAQAADLAVIMVRAAWELQLAGERGAWERVEGPFMADLARAFAREACLDFRALNNGTAAAAVFEAWFLSERCRTEDRRLIQQMLADYGGHVFETGEDGRAVTADLIAALGTMPFGKNYLAGHAATIMNDALFAEVRDRANANFLWFIKFERSFREAERDLQSESSVRDAGDSRGTPSKNRTDKRIGNHEKTADIIALPAGVVQPGLSRRVAGGSADIIAFKPDFRK